jgi:hypothetical protein
VGNVFSAYAAVAVIREVLQVFYPYWFLNTVDEYSQGIGSFAILFIFISVVSVAFVMAGYLIDCNKPSFFS